MTVRSQALATAVKHLEAGQPRQAEQVCRQILRADPTHAGACHLLGIVALQVGDYQAAADCIRRAIVSNPYNAVFHGNLGTAHYGLGRLDEAVANYRQAVQLKPDYADGHYNLANALRDQGKLDEAVASYRRALEIKPDYAEAYNNLGGVLRRQGAFEEAVASHQQALRLKPDFAEAHYNLGIAQKDLGKLDEAVVSLRKAVQLKPESAKAHAGLAIPLLLTGKFAEGWREYEWRTQCEECAVSPLCRPRWDGSPLGARTIMLFAEQGLGDTLHFVRYAALLKRRGGKVLLECQPALVRLLEKCRGVDGVFPRGSQLPQFDIAISLASLPATLGTTGDSIPAEIPYLDADAALVERWRAELGAVGGFKVGIVWQGNPDHPDDRWRSMPLAQFEPLARLEGARLISLQKGPGADQLEVVQDRFPVMDLGPGLDEQSGAFMDTAAVMEHLDLVITSDTSIAHLAGALGVAVWVALPVVPDWRWMLDRDDSPWYPTMRLFRQRTRGNWEEVFQRMAVALRKQIGLADRATPITVEISPGELIDKITILEIKSQRIDDPEKLANVRVELSALVTARDRALKRSQKLDELTTQLRAVNEALWQILEDIYQCELQRNFGPRFVELARSVYFNNDRRTALKRQINELFDSRLIEEKSYGSHGEERPD